MDEHEYWWRNKTIVAGMDIGKKGNPSHFSAFAIDDDLSRIDDHGNPLEILINISQKFLDGWDYTRQVLFIKDAVNYFNIQRMYYDATRGELDERGLPRQCIPIILGARTGRTAKGKIELATNFAKLVETKRIRLLDNDRFISQILCLTPGTKIFVRYGDHTLRKGYKNIEDINIGDKVRTHLGRLRKVIGVYKRFVSEEIISLKLGNKVIIKITKEHPILTVDGWKRAGDLTTDDILMKFIHSHSKINRPAEGQTYEEYYGIEKARKIKEKQRGLRGVQVTRIEWECPVCKKILYLRPKYAATRKFCSRKCSGIFYSDKVKFREGFGAASLKGDLNPNYKEEKTDRIYPIEFNNILKREIYKRDKYTCKLCGKSHTLVHCHHIDYDKMNIDKLNLITLCNSCHSKTTYTNKKEYWKNILKNKMLGEVELCNGTRIVKISKEFYSGYVYNLKVYEDKTYAGKGIIFHNCVSNDLQAPNTSMGHGDSFISVMLAVGVYFDFFARDRNLGFSYLGDTQELLNMDSPTSGALKDQGSVGTMNTTMDRYKKYEICKVCNGRTFETLPDGRKKCIKCFTVWDL